MKKILTLALVLALAVTGLSGCSGNGGTTSDKSPEELAQLYHTAITDNGGEMVEYNPVITEKKEDDGSAMLLEMLGLDTGDMTAFGISASMMNVKAYVIHRRRHARRGEGRRCERGAAGLHRPTEEQL